MPHVGSMAVCELCGAEGVSTNRGIVSNVTLDVCTKCTESIGIEIHKSPFEDRASNVRKQAPRPMRVQHERELSNDFHIQLRNARESKGWSQKELAHRMNVRINSIQKAESGTRPTDDLINKLEKVLDIDLREESDAGRDSMVSRASSRGMTIADALDEFLQKGD
tara:strand:+ start:4951 stop:5445 length:495 start_codon:yes stop_codon:yes gene_type:complete